MLKEMGLNYHRRGIIKMGQGFNISDVKKSIDVYVGSVGTSVEPHRPVDLPYDSKAHISAGYIYSSSGEFHGAIDVSTKSQPDVAALAMFNVRLVDQKKDWWSSIAGWKLIMKIEDDYNINGKSCKGMYLVYFHLAEEPVKYLIRKGYIQSEEYIERTVIPAGKPVGIIGGTGIDSKKGTWKPGDDRGYHIHLHLHIQPKQNSERGERINLDQFFLDRNWYKRMAILAGKPYYDGL